MPLKLTVDINHDHNDDSMNVELSCTSNPAACQEEIDFYEDLAELIKLFVNGVETNTHRHQEPAVPPSKMN